MLIRRRNILSKIGFKMERQMAIFGYARVSTRDQDLASQVVHDEGRGGSLVATAGTAWPVSPTTQNAAGTPGTSINTADAAMDRRLTRPLWR
jgi:hypothetical protein